MRLSLEKKKKKKKNKKLKLQAAMEGTSHRTATGGFRKTGNGEQYAFKKVNIEECHSHLYVQTCCQLVALCP